MSFDDRLRDELRRATQSQPIDEEAALHDVRTSATERSASVDTVVVPLEETAAPRRRRVRVQRIIGVAAAVALIAGAVAIPLALRNDHQDDTATPRPAPKTPLVNRGALQAVASALDATTGAGSFHVEYTLSETPGTMPTTTSCRTEVARDSAGAVLPARPPVTICGASYPNNNVTTTGNATVNVAPFAMKAVSNVSNFGDVTVHVDDTNYWETTGTNPAEPTGPGSPISSFASLVEATLGPREGAGAMMGLANPGGYLTITREAITGARQLGTGTIDGQAVINYRVNVDPAQLAAVPGLSPEQHKTIVAALAVLQQQGFTGNVTDVSVDARGFIVHTQSTNSFADGGRVVSEDTFSQFGCAGVVAIPGRPVSTASDTCAAGNAPTTTLPPGDHSIATPPEATVTTAPAATTLDPTATPTTLSPNAASATVVFGTGSDATTTTGSQTP